ncbi:MAG: hypothetical protein GX129_01505 [Clostridiales bacterium]|jgi:hypothetical protein|nr:hypothetical protein [Clostridiales bacterium]
MYKYEQLVSFYFLIEVSIIHFQEALANLQVEASLAVEAEVPADTKNTKNCINNRYKFTRFLYMLTKNWIYVNINRFKTELCTIM